MSVRYSLSAPTLGSMLMQLSFSTTSMSAPMPPAWLRASKAMPAVMAPSPITATLRRSCSPLSLLATAMPRAPPTEVLLWPTPKVS
jgi:hypothetical protein